jgi:hypothetical protein
MVSRFFSYPCYLRLTQNRLQSPRVNPPVLENQCQSKHNMRT